MPARRHRVACLCSALLFSACSTGPELDIKIEESAQGAVYLKRISDGSLQAAHPIKIDPVTIALVLSGILVREQQPAAMAPAGASDTRPVFSGSEVGYLAPLISEGLRRAAPDQQVRFRTGQIGEPGLSQRVGTSKPSTTAVLYAYGRSLYVTLTQYHSRQEAATAATMANKKIPDTIGLANRALSFVPEAAKRPDTYLDVRSTDNTLVIDYELLTMLPPASSVPASAKAAPPPTEPHTTNGEKAETARKDAEIGALRQELQEIKKQLAEQQAERARSQPKNAVPQR